MKLNRINSQNNIFKINVETKLVDCIKKEIVDKIDKVEYSELYLKKLLETDYTSENLYVRLKSILLNSKINVSIKKFDDDNKFIFYRMSKEINRETDIFKIKFEKIIPIIRNQLKEKYIFAIEEIAFKTTFNVDYDIITLYNKIRHILINTDIGIKIEENKVVDKKCTNIIEFYIINETNLSNKMKESFRKKNEIEKINEKERVKNMVNDDMNDEENKSLEIINEIPTNIPLPYTVICLKCKNKVILKYPELNCPKCNSSILKNWNN